MPSQYGPGNYPSNMGQEPFKIAHDLIAATGTTAGGVLALANPLGVDLIILNSVLDIKSAAAAPTNTIDAGIAANGTTSSDTLYDGQAASAGLKSPGGTNGAVPRKWGATQYITGTASATLAGMVAVLHLTCVRA